MLRKTIFVTSVLAVFACASQAQFILAVDSGRDRIAKLDAHTGAMIDANFIVDANNAGTYDFSTPKAIAIVNSEIWVSDQLADSVFRFDGNGAFLGKTTGMDNIRGLGRVGNEVWVSSGGPVYRLDLNGGMLGSFASVGGSSFDVFQLGNDVLITDSSSDDIEKYDTSGNSLGNFYSSPGTGDLNFPEQIAFDGTNLFVAGFSAPAGLYRFDASGNKTGFWSVTGNLGLRGVATLGNGQVLLTGGTRLFTFDLTNSAEINISNATGESWQYLTSYNPVPEPATLALLGIGLVAFAKKRKTKAVY